jgi:hypothetical protein
VTGDIRGAADVCGRVQVFARFFSNKSSTSGLINEFSSSPSNVQIKSFRIP